MMPPEPTDDQQRLWRDVLSAATGAEHLHVTPPPFAPTFEEGKRAVRVIQQQVNQAMRLITRMLDGDLLPQEHVDRLKQALTERAQREAAVRLFGILYGDDADDDTPPQYG